LRSRLLNVRPLKQQKLPPSIRVEPFTGILAQCHRFTGHKAKHALKKLALVSLKFALTSKNALSLV